MAISRAGAPASMTKAPRPRARRPVALIVVSAMTAFLGLTAVAGGTEMVAFRSGNSFLPPAWLDRLPLVDSWLGPGLVLGLGFGVGALVATYGLLRRPRWRLTAPVERLTGQHWSWVASVLLGIGLVVWIALEVIYLPDRSWLELVYGLLGMLLAALPWSRPVRADLRVTVQS